MIIREVGYSGSDLQALCEEAAMMPIRELGTSILTIKANQVTQPENVIVLATDYCLRCTKVPFIRFLLLKNIITSTFC